MRKNVLLEDESFKKLINELENWLRHSQVSYAWWRW